MDDPRKTFMDDVLVIPVNMAGLPGLNIPVGFDKENMPIGMHIIGNALYSPGTGDETSTFSLNMNFIGAIIPGDVTGGPILC